jgi:hypothetical protein
MSTYLVGFTLGNQYLVGIIYATVGDHIGTMAAARQPITCQMQSSQKKFECAWQGWDSVQAWY